FFATVIKPYLANKKDKTFLDQWLLDADVAEYSQPWRHGRLNVSERVLLSQRLPGEPAKTSRHLADLLKLLPPNIDRDVMLFDTSVSNSAMAVDGPRLKAETTRLEFATEEPRAQPAALPGPAVVGKPADPNAALGGLRERKRGEK